MLGVCHSSASESYSIFWLCKQASELSLFQALVTVEIHHKLSVSICCQHFQNNVLTSRTFPFWHPPAAMKEQSQCAHVSLFSLHPPTHTLVVPTKNSLLRIFSSGCGLVSIF